LTEAELDWRPPDEGWPLRRVLHHVARSEPLYSASLDEALPDESTEGGILRSADELIDDVLVMESELLAEPWRNDP
jgi:hypothetical protein